MSRRELLATTAIATTSLASGCSALRSILDRPPSIAWEYDAEVQSVARDQDHVVVTTDRHLVGLDSTNGEVDWRHYAGSVRGLEYDDSTYYGYGGAGVLAVDRADGSERWSVDSNV